MVPVLHAAIGMGWVISLVSVSSRTCPGVCWPGGILAGVAFAAARASSSRARAVPAGAPGRAGILFVMTMLVPAAGLCSAASFPCRDSPAWVSAFLAVLTAAAAVFFAGLGTSRPGASAMAAQESMAPGAKWVRAYRK